MAGPGFSSEVLVQVDGRGLPREAGAMLVRAVLDETRLAPAVCELWFRDPDQAVLAAVDIAIGSRLDVSVSSTARAAPAALVSAEVTALELEHDGTGTYTIVRGIDRLHRLLRGRRVEGYRQMTVSDVVEKVARRAGIEVGHLDRTATVHEQISQANVSDWEFLNGLAADVGARLRMVDDRLELRRATSAAGQDPGTDPDHPLVLELGRDLLACRAVVTSTAQVPELSARGWDALAKRPVTSTAAATSRTAAVGADPEALAAAFDAPALLVVEPPFEAQSEVDEAAAAAADHVGGACAELEAVVNGNAAIRVGAVVSLTGAGHPFAGAYTVSATRHTFDPETGYRTHATMSGDQDRTLLGLTSSPPGHSTAGLDGVVPALVSDNRDPEELGRVRLVLPWLSDEFVTGWARTVQLGAGDQRGTLFVPEVGDEVLVAFQDGHLRRPFVLGGLYNGVDRPRPGRGELIDSNSGAVNRRAIVSRTGHRIELTEDANGAQGVTIATGDGALGVVLDQRSTRVQVRSDGSVTVQAGGAVEVEAGESLTLSGRDVSITARGNISLDAGRSVSVTGGTEATVSAPTVSVDGASVAELTAGATCTIRAALVRIN